MLAMISWRRPGALEPFTALFLFLSLFLAALCPAACFNPRRAARPPAADPGLASRVHRVEHGFLPPVVVKGQSPAPASITERMAFWKVPGVSVAVIDRGVIDWARGYGVAEAGTGRAITPDTLFQAASISKPVSATAALRLVQEGKLALDEDVNLRLSSWKVPAADFTREQKVTLRRLLSHTAGLTVHGFRGYSSGEAVPTLLQVLNGEKPANSGPITVDILPGSESRYSGGGYTVAQQLLSDAAHQPFDRLVGALVLEPLGMSRSGYHPPAPDAVEANVATAHDREGKRFAAGRWHRYPELAAAGLWTTATDLARFAIEIQRSAAARSNKVLSVELTRAMLTPVKGEYGLGLGLAGSDQTRAFTHGGANQGFRCLLFAFVETGQGAVVMTNADNGDRLAEEVMRAVARAYQWPGPRFSTGERAAIAVDPALFAPYLGRYLVDGRHPVSVTGDDARLFVQAAPFGPDRTELHAESEVKFFITAADVNFTFVKDTAGQVTELLIEAPGRLIHARKAR